MEASGGFGLAQQHIEARFDDGRDALVERLNLAGMDIDADDAVPLTGKATGGHGTDISQAENGNLHAGAEARNPSTETQGRFARESRFTKNVEDRLAQRPWGARGFSHLNGSAGRNFPDTSPANVGWPSSSSFREPDPAVKSTRPRSTQNTFGEMADS